MHFHRANRIVRLSINTLVTLALMMAIAGSLGASTLPAKALAGSDPAGAGHLLSIDALWSAGISQAVWTWMWHRFREDSLALSRARRLPRRERTVLLNRAKGCVAAGV